jgi:hypothetical protein
MRTGALDPSRGKRKSKTGQRGRPVQSVRKPGDNSPRAAKEKAPPKSQESKALGECLCRPVPLEVDDRHFTARTVETVQRSFVVLPGSFADNTESLVMRDLTCPPVTTFCSDRSSGHLRL